MVYCIFKFSLLQSLRALVAMNESLKSQEQEFKAHCRVSFSFLWKALFKAWKISIILLPDLSLCGVSLSVICPPPPPLTGIARFTLNIVSSLTCSRIVDRCPVLQCIISAARQGWWPGRWELDKQKDLSLLWGREVWGRLPRRTELLWPSVVPETP